MIQNNNFLMNSFNLRNFAASMKFAKYRVLVYVFDILKFQAYGIFELGFSVKKQHAVKVRLWPGMLLA